MGARKRKIAEIVRIAAILLLSEFGLAISESSPASEAPNMAIIAQLPRYSASGTHRCEAATGEKRNCVVSGLFATCGDATLSLRTRDCCRSKGGGASTGFILNYCIPDVSGR